MNLFQNLLKMFVGKNTANAGTAKNADKKIEDGIPGDGDFPGIITARVLEVSKHPNADRLRIARLDAGGDTIEPVVCGAFNFEAGDVVALALPGARIAQNIHSDSHEPFVLDKAKIRGVESQGMICAAYELGLADKPGEGIMLLKKDTAPGCPFKPDMVV